ncbi:MAG TPA: phosphate ABC transporter substrate-binding protein [Desulfobacteria bacterium]|nr:phosphate ABC transporter substrate-binding protein [Desulfobacteria bacterium]
MFKTVRRQAVALGVAALVIVGLVGCGSAQQTSTSSSQTSNQTGQSQLDKKVITAAGSTALQPLVKVAASDFAGTNPGYQVNVSGGGSFTGLNNVASGAIDIGDSDVDVAAAPQLQDKGLVDHKVAVAPFLIIVNPDVNVDNLTQAQLKDIFTGKITNWKAVGGKDEKISIIGRAKSSGSRATIKKIVLEGAEFTDAATAQDSTGNLITAVGQTPGAIGYIDAAYLNDKVKALKYNGVEYTPDNVFTGKYPIYAYEHMFTKGEATGTVKAFLDYILSADFQANTVVKKGFLPLDKMQK